MPKTTYKDLFRLVQEQIEKRIQFQGTKRFQNQLDRTDIGPIFNNPVSDVRASEIVSAVQELLIEALPGKIIEGLSVSETDPPSSSVIVAAGKATKGGRLFELEEDTTIPIHFDPITEVIFLNIFEDRILIEKNERENAVTIAKIIIPDPSRNFAFRDFNIYNNKDQRADELQPYIASFQPVNLYQDATGKLEEESLEFFRDNIGPILSENLIGNIRLSENLKITNTQGTLELDSNSIKILDGDSNITAKFNKHGTFYYNSDGIEIARFATDSARIGNITITTNSIQSGNFVSGNLGAGFQIQDSGDAEFNNIRARGKLTASVFEKDTVSVIGGNLLVMDGDILDEDMTSSDSSELVISGDTTFSVNDVLRIKDGVDDEWLTVTAVNGTRYTVTRDRAGSYSANNNPAWTKGTSVVNFGASGEGGIYLTSSESNAPYISIVTHAGSPWSTLCTHGRFGNLNGFLGYATDTYGIGIGNTTEYLKYDPSNGLQISGSITVTGGNASVTFYQATEPGSSGDSNTPKQGDFWIDTDDDNTLYTYQSGVWQLAQDFGSGSCVFRQTSIPTSTSAGDLWIDTDDNDRLYRATNAGDDQITSGEWELIKTVCADSSGSVVSNVKPGTNIGTPSGAGLFLGADYLGYYDSNDWKVYIDNNGQFLFQGDASNFVSWSGTTLCVRGLLNADDITVGSLCADRIGAGTIDITNGITISSNPGTGARTEFTSTGIESYDADNEKAFEICNGVIKAWDTTQSGNPLTFCLMDGCICAQQLKLQDPDCTCCYSFLDAGSLKFHDELGDVPYVKRISSGTGNNGDWVCLLGYRDIPDVIVSIKALNSYDATFTGQDQRWCVYHSDLTCYCNSGLDYGYCFKLNATLELGAATASESIKNAAYATCVYSNVNTCASTIKHCLRFYCHGTAPANWCYGCFCWRICYRCFGSGVWCQSLVQTYVQPHANTTQMTTINSCSICFNWGASSGPSGCWEIMAVQTGLTWLDSGIASGTTTCHLCQRALTGNSQTVTACACVDDTESCSLCTANVSAGADVSIAGAYPSNVFCTYVCYCWCTFASDHMCSFVCHIGLGVGSCVNQSACAITCFTAISGSGNTQFLACTGASQTESKSCAEGFCCYNCTIQTTVTTGVSTDLAGLANRNYTKICLCVRACGCVSKNIDSFFDATSRAVSDVCFFGGNLFHCYCCVSGAAAGDETKCIHSLTDTLATATILDSSGELNWLAIAYS